ADVIVSSDTSWLTMDDGVALAIRRAAGEAIHTQACTYRPVRAGRVIVTGAGALAARFIFHGITLGELRFDKARPSSRDLITEILTSCFYHAESLEVRSMALPLLGTGGAGFSREVCLDTMFRFLARVLLRGLTPVQEVTVVVYDDGQAPRRSVLLARP